MNEFLYFLDSNGNAIITNNYRVYPESDLEIPSIIDGHPVVGIDSYAFYKHTELLSVLIPNSITSIGTEAFSYCSNLLSVVIGNGVKAIKRFAFAYAGLREVVIPDNVSSMEEATFMNCTNLKSVTIGDGVKIIEKWTFQHTGLEEINIPSNVTAINDYAFEGCSYLKKMTITDGLISIGNDAFVSSGLEEVDLPDTLTVVGGSVFGFCQNLKKVNIGNGLATINNYMFSACSYLTNVIFGNSVNTIGDGAFAACKSLTNIIIPYSVTGIGECAFEWCEKLISAKFFGDAPVTFSKYIFDNCGPNFKIYYFYGKKGFTTPVWNGYTSIPLYVVTYDANGGVGTVPIDNNTYLKGDSVTVLSPANLSKNGFVFDGWALYPNGPTIYVFDVVNNIFNPFTFLIEGTSNITLYAKWMSPNDFINKIIDYINNEINNGHIQGIGKSLISKLKNISNMIAIGDIVTATNLLNDFINQVSSQSGKKIDKATADKLISLAQLLISTLN